MRYSDLISGMTEKVYQAGVATKIMQHMDKIKNVSDISQARRWPMELIQNARDVAYDEGGLKVRIELDDDKLVFSHTGKPFRIKDILSIINQVSSKESTDDSTIGKFGTGFMTTFQLSPVVEIKSVLKDMTDEGELPYKNFSIYIDRRGNTKEEILASIEKSVEQLKETDSSQEILDFSKDAFNTSFVYHLDNKNSREIAKIGMDDLDCTVLYVLLFSSKVESIELVYRLFDKNKTVKYSRKHNDFSQDVDGIRREYIEKSETDGVGSIDNVKTEEKCLLYVKKYYKEDNKDIAVWLATEWSEEQGFLPLAEKTSRVFIDFPLVGSEQFPFPMVINSTGFNPNEPRSGISLVDKEDSPDATKNKRFMKYAVSMYDDFLTAAGNNYCKHIENIVMIPKWQENKEMSTQWVSQNIYGALYSIISTKHIISTQNGMKKALDNDLFFIESETEDDKLQLRKILSAIKNVSYPIGDEQWFEALFNYGLIESKIINLGKLIDNETYYLARIDENVYTAMQWCQLLYDTACENEEQLTRIKAGEAAVFPNQADWNERKLFKINDIKVDPAIPEILKDVSEQLSILKRQAYETTYSIRKELLNLDFKVNDKTDIRSYETSILTNYIAERSSRGYVVVNYIYYSSIYLKAWESAWLLMVKCGPDDNLYQVVKSVYGNRLGEREKIEGFADNIWNNTYKGIIKGILKKVEELKKLDTLKQTFFSNETDMEPVYDWLNLLYQEDVMYRASEYESISCLPNQEGNFNTKSNLKRDSVHDDELKSIVYCFKSYYIDDNKEYDIYKRLLDPKITYNESDMYEFGIQDAASLIGNAVRKALNEKSLSEHSEAVQDACSSLMGWIDNHEAQAIKYFSDYSSDEDKMKLLTPKSATKIKKKADAVDKLMKENNLSNVEEITKIFEERNHLKGCNQELENEKKRLEDENKKLLEELERLKSGMTSEETTFESGTSSNGGGSYYINGYGFGDDLMELDYEKRMDAIRYIGTECELYAYRRLISYYKSEGFEMVSQIGGYTCMDKAGLQVKILYPDYQKSGGRTYQSGWDISVENITEGTVEYYEVKGHTLRSRVRGRVILTDEQMKKAISCGEGYKIFLVDFDWDRKKIASYKIISNPIKAIEKDELTSYDGKYFFWDKSGAAVSAIDLL